MCHSARGLSALTLGLTVFGAATPAIASACTIPISSRVTLPGTTFQDQAGAAVAVHGDLAVIGMPLADAPGQPRIGAAWVIDADEAWVMHELVQPDIDAEDRHGAAVAIHDGIAVVGTPFTDEGANNAGSAYVYDATTGAMLHELTAPVPREEARFGSEVAIWGTRVVVAAPHDDRFAPGGGAAYVFDATTGAHLYTLGGSDTRADDQFGRGVAVRGDRILVGASLHDAGANWTGSAYLFDAATGAEIDKLLAPMPEADDFFGFSVALGDGFAAVGAREDDDAGWNAGAVHVFDSADGAWLRTLTAPDAGIVEHFGFDIAADGDRVLIGARHDDDAGFHAGSVYLFDLAAGDYLDKHIPADVASEDRLGFAVGLSGDRGIAGAPYHDEAANDGGAAFVLELACTPEGDVTGAGGVPDGTVDFLDLLLVIATWGVCEDPENCPADVDGDGEVGLSDLLAVLSNWG